eukprot:1259574-Amphidinium_carterae.1
MEQGDIFLRTQLIVVDAVHNQKLNLACKMHICRSQFQRRAFDAGSGQGSENARERKRKGNKPCTYVPLTVLPTCSIDSVDSVLGALIAVGNALVTITIEIMVSQFGCLEKDAHHSGFMWPKWRVVPLLRIDVRASPWCSFL